MQTGRSLKKQIGRAWRDGVGRQVEECVQIQVTRNVMRPTDECVGWQVWLRVWGTLEGARR